MIVKYLLNAVTEVFRESVFLRRFLDSAVSANQRLNMDLHIKILNFGCVEETSYCGRSMRLLLSIRYAMET